MDTIKSCCEAFKENVMREYGITDEQYKGYSAIAINKTTGVDKEDLDKMAECYSTFRTALFKVLDDII